MKQARGCVAVLLSFKLQIDIMSMPGSDETNKVCYGAVISKTADRYSAHALLRQNKPEVVLP